LDQGNPARLDHWVADDVASIFRRAIEGSKLDARVEAPGGGVLVFEYAALSTGTGYVLPRVLLEFGARSTGEPAERRSIACDLAVHLPSLGFPTAEPRVMLPTRTFWEKATAIHVFCRLGRFRAGDRFARHWYDLMRLDEAGIADQAIADVKLAREVARHKQLFFEAEDGVAIDYSGAVSGNLMLVPEGAARAALGNDYTRMIADGLLLGDAPTFETLMERCAAIAAKADAAAAPGADRHFG
jgi:hypothetical protein